MFANTLKVEKDNGFLGFVATPEMISYDISSNEIVVGGKINASKQFLVDNKLVLRVLFVSNETDYNQAITNDEILIPAVFSYLSDEIVASGVNVSQRIITQPEFSFSIPYTSDLQNTKIVFSFIYSYIPENQLNYYKNNFSFIASSDILINQEVSDKTLLSVLLEDAFLLEEQQTLATSDTNSYFTEIYYTLDENNNFYASMFYNVESFFRDKIFYKNLLNYSDFVTYFRNNYIVSVNPYLKKDIYTLPLSFASQQNVVLDSGKDNNYIIVNSDSIDTIKFNDSTLSVDFTYEESSVQYILNNIIPYLSNLNSNISEGFVDNSFIPLLVYYKLAKEKNSTTDNVNKIIEFSQTNQRFLLSKNLVDQIIYMIGYTKEKYIDAISKVTSENQADTVFTIESEQKIDLLYTNAQIEFIDLDSNTALHPTYSRDNFQQGFSTEVQRFFGVDTPTINDTSLPFNTLSVNFSPKSISISNKKTYENDFTFTDYDSVPIQQNQVDTIAYNFAKILAYFTLNRDEKTARAYSFPALLNSNLSYNNLVVQQISAQLDRADFSITKRDNSLSYNSFPANLKNDVCLDPSIVVEPENIQTARTTRETPENLFNNLTVNYSLQDSNLYSNAYENVSVSSDIPVQVLYPYSQFENRTNTLFENSEPVVADSKLFSIFYTNFRLIGKVEYLSDLSPGMFSFWKPLNMDILNNLTASQRIFCRLTFYRNSQYGIQEQSFDEFSIYNRYFYIEA